MKVEIKNSNISHEINVGDIFVESDCDVAYLLIERASLGELELRSFNSKYRWAGYPNINNARGMLSKNVSEGRLIHYPQSKYKLVLEEI